MLDSLGLQQAPHLDRPGRREAAIAVHQQRRFGAEGAADRRHDGLGAARPFVDVMAAFRADAELEGVEAEACPAARGSARLRPPA